MIGNKTTGPQISPDGVGTHLMGQEGLGARLTGWADSRRPAAASGCNSLSVAQTLLPRWHLGAIVVTGQSLEVDISQTWV